MGAPLDIKMFGYYPGANCTSCQKFSNCGGKGHKWDFNDIKASLLDSYGDRISVSLINVFSEEVKAFPDIVAFLKEHGLLIPVLVIEGEIISWGGEATEDVIRKVIDFLLSENSTEIVVSQ